MISKSESKNGSSDQRLETVVSALIRFGETSDPYSGSTDPRSSGNGSLMRLAPIPLFYADCHADAMIFAALSSKTTLALEDCIACCQYFAHTLLNTLSGEQDKARLFPTPADLVFTPSMAHVENQAFKDKSADDVAGTGYVVESLEAAIWAFWHTTNYRDAILAAANLGDDADTTAAICGQLAGAYYGAEAMPGNWTSSLHKADEIRSTARRLVLHN